MTLEEKQELIKSAKSEEELEERMKQIADDKEPEEKPEEKPEEEKPEEKPEEENGEISKEEERSLIKDTMNVEQRSIQVKPIERKGEFKMEEKVELRNSKEYIDAYAEFIKTGEDTELRALITTDGYATGNSATVAVPDLVYDVVKTAWEREELMRLVRNISVKGNMKVNFEVSADGANVHTEGYGAVPEENLVLGIVELKPVAIKKYLKISDEAISMRGEAFLRYVYDELTYRVAKKCADVLIGKIALLPSSLSPNASGIYDTVSANALTQAPGLGVVAEAIANLSDETRDITIVMNKLTYANFKAAQYAAGFPIDPFEGARVIFNNTLPAYNSASTNDVYAIVGDFDHGALANYPDGEGIEIKYDDTSLMEYDLVKILGRRYVGAEPVADKSFTLLKKPASV